MSTLANRAGRYCQIPAGTLASTSQWAKVREPEISPALCVAGSNDELTCGITPFIFLFHTVFSHL